MNMGTIIERICPECSYRKEFYEGVGMGGRNSYIIRSVFTPEEIADFSKKLEENRIKDYLLSKHVGYCKKCNALESVCFLDYTDTADNKVQIQKPCPACESMLDFSDKKEECPVCSALLIKAQIGVWD